MAPRASLFGARGRSDTSTITTTTTGCRCGARLHRASLTSWSSLIPNASSSHPFLHREPSNWLGIFLDMPRDEGVDWEEIAEILEDAFRIIAPAADVAELDRR